MSYYSKIHVQHQSGTKATGKRVSLDFHYGGITKGFYTDRKGVALIEHSSRGKATIYVSGSNKGTFNAPGETVVFI